MAITTKTAQLAGVGGSPIVGTIKFTQDLKADGSGKLTIKGTAKNFANTTTVYVSLVYGVNSVTSAPTPCRDDGTLGSVILDATDIGAAPDLLKNAVSGIPLIGPLMGQVTSKITGVLVPALQTGLGPLSAVNMPPPGGMLFSPAGTARMFLGVWGFANPQGDSTLNVVRTWTGPNDPLAIPLSKLNTVSIRQPQFPLLPNPTSDMRPQIFQLRCCGQLM